MIKARDGFFVMFSENHLMAIFTAWVKIHCASKIVILSMSEIKGVLMLSKFVRESFKKHFSNSKMHCQTSLQISLPTKQSFQFVTMVGIQRNKLKQALGHNRMVHYFITEF